MRAPRHSDASTRHHHHHQQQRQHKCSLLKRIAADARTHARTQCGENKNDDANAVAASGGAVVMVA